MSAVREAWTDERLDDLSNRMDRGFDRVDAEIRGLRSEMNGRLDGMQRTMLAMLASMAVGFVTVLGSVIATQL